METGIIRFYRATPMPLWLFYTLVYVDGFGICLLLSWLTSVLIQCPNERFSWSSLISAGLSWLVFVCLLSVAYVDVDLSGGKIVSKNILKHIGIKIEISVQDILEIRLNTKKRYGDNVVIITTEKAYNLSIGNCEQFAKLLQQRNKDIRLTMNA